MIKWLTCAAAALAFSGVGLTAFAQDIALVRARVITMGPAGTIENATVVVRNGRIQAVGADIPVPAGLRVVDGTGTVVTPGLFATATTLGGDEMQITQRLDDTTTHSQTVSAGFDVRYGVDTATPFVAQARAEGVTRAVTLPTLSSRSGGKEAIFAGSGAVIRLSVLPGSVTKPAAGLVVALGEQGALAAGGGRGAAIALLRTQLAEARDYSAGRGHYRAAHTDSTLSQADLEALQPVIRREEPLVALVNRAADIRQIIELAAAERLKLVLLGAAEGWQLADEIAAAHVPVVLDANENVAGSFEMFGATLENAARLAKAGVLIAIWPENANIGWPIRTPRFVAGIAVANGLPYDNALAAITINPARIFGVEAKLGSIEVGKSADLVVWSGDPLETSTRPLVVLIEGIQQSLITRDELLLRKYVPNAIPQGAR